MQVSILLFAGARELAGTDRLAVRVPDHGTYGDVVEALEQDCPALTSLLKSSRIAANEQYVDLGKAIDPAAELALIPAVSGG